MYRDITYAYVNNGKRREEGRKRGRVEEEKEDMR
jgi:hypothetical protein